MRHKAVSWALAGALLWGLAGCFGGAGSSDFVARQATTPETSRFGLRAPNKTTQKIAAESAVIQGLAARQSALPPDSAYDAVAQAVLAANARTSETELRAAKLRAEAAATNWLPRLGPEISLTSLSSVVASLVLDATIFDHGRKKAERAFAAADVEVAAVHLAQDSNDRVAAALDLYLTVQEGRDGAARDAATLRDMNHFLHVMTRRVEGGVSDMSDLNVIRQKVSEIRASQARNHEAARTALAELNAMSVRPLDSVSGLPRLDVAPGAAQALEVTRSQAEATRAVAQAKVDRANQLPGVTAQVRAGDNSGTVLRSDGTLGLGTGASIKAIEASREAADRAIAQAEEDAARVLSRLTSQIAAKDRQAQEAARLTGNAKANLDLFERQFEAGQRQVIDVVQVYETFARQQAAQVALTYEAAALRVELARVLGVLADGEAI